MLHRRTRDKVPSNLITTSRSFCLYERSLTEEARSIRASSLSARAARLVQIVAKTKFPSHFSAFASQCNVVQ